MASRLELQKLLKTIMGNENVYFQPPAKINYPAIKYSLNNVKKTTASNEVYNLTNCYTLTLIDKNPDSIFVNKILSLPMCSFDRYYVADNLHHYIFTLYY